MTKQRTILITGATDGIGLALAKLYAGRRARLVLIGRRPLDLLPDPLFRPENYCQIDLAESDCAVRLTAWLDVQSIYELDLVIHNAGMAYIGQTETQNAKNILQMLAVNLYAPLQLTHALLPRLVSTHGKVVFIGSARALLPCPHYAVYAASKAALAGFVRNWQIELAASNVGISAQIIHPGATQTGLHRKAGQSDMAGSFPAADITAQQIAQAIAGKERSVVLNGGERILLAMQQRFPGLVERVMRRQRRSPSAAETKHVVITGAAQGIGKSLAERFAEAGYMITGVDLDAKTVMYTQAELINDFDAQVRFAIADLALPSEIERVLESLEGRPPIDVLIHNAGINEVGPFAIGKLLNQVRVLDVNLTAPLLLTAGILHQKRLAPGASIGFLSSLSHFVSYPGAAVYAASKDGLSAYASALSVALAAQGHHMLTVYPGPTRTDHARRYSPDNSREEERMPPEDVAEQIFQAIQRRRRILVPGLRNRQLALAARWFPGRAEAVMRRQIYAKLATRR
jgi:hypothetical protein